MDGQDYLNQISATVRPEKKSKMSFMSSTIFKVIAGAVVAFILIAVFGAIINGGKAGARDQAIALKLNLDGVLEVISEYQPSVKSSNLRSSSASLYSILSNTNRELENNITETYKYNPKSDDKKFEETTALERDGLSSALFEAKINGILDQVYANKMAYTISLIMSNESSLSNATSNEDLQTILSSSYNSLDTLYSQFSDFQK